MRWWLAVIVAVAVGLRIALALVHPFWFPDSADYDCALARGMLAGRGYGVGGLFASRMPGYPVFLAGVYAVSGGSMKAALVLQAVMGGGIVWMVYVLGRRGGEAVGLVAAGLAAVDPLSVGFSAAVLSETAFTLMLLVGVWICVRMSDEAREHMRHGSEYRPVAPGLAWGRWVVLGVVWGMAVYLRAEALWCVVVLGWVAGIGCGRSWAGRPCHFGLLVTVAIMFLMLAPWQLRNYQLFHGGYLRMTTLEGISLYESVYPGADGGPKQDEIALPAEMKGMNEAQRNDEWMRRGWGYVFAEPGRMANLTVRKVGRTWSPFLNAGEFQRPMVQILMGLWHISLFILAVIGLVGPMIPPRMKALLLAPFFYFTAVHALFLGSVRYRVPLMPVVCLFAAAGVVYLLRRMRRQPAVEGVV